MRVTVGDLALDLTDAQVKDLREQLRIVVDFPTGGKMLTAEQAADRLGFSIDYVRDHAVELGGVKLTDSPKAQWRFDPTKLGLMSKPKSTPPIATARRRVPGRSGVGQLLKARG